MLPLCSFVVEGGSSSDVGAYFDAGRCIGTIQALRRLGPMLVDGAFCVPSDVTAKQMVRTAVVGLKRRPEALHHDFTYLAAFVFSDIWPCAPANKSK
jgi:hypothetical protein